MRTAERNDTYFIALTLRGKIYIFDPNKGMQYCNDQFFNLTGHPRCAFDDVDWKRIILEEDFHIVDDAWKVLLEKKQPTMTQFRLKDKEWKNNGESFQAWAQGMSYAEVEEDGSITSIMGTLVE